MRAQAQLYLQSFASPVGSALPIVMTVLHNARTGRGEQGRFDRQQALDLEQQDIGVARLEEHQVETRRLGALQLARLRIACRGNERDTVRVRVLPKAACNVEPRDLRQFEVEHNEVRKQEFGLLERRSAVARRR